MKLSSHLHVSHLAKHQLAPEGERGSGGGEGLVDGCFCFVLFQLLSSGWFGGAPAFGRVNVQLDSFLGGREKGHTRNTRTIKINGCVNKKNFF